MMLTAQVVEDLLLRLSEPVLEKELVSLAESLGRVLAEPISSAVDFPHWDNSAMDGYAVRWEDVAAPLSPAPPSRTKLTVIEEIPAGVRPQRSLAAGEAARIFTGAMLPIGADTILIQENTERDGDSLQDGQARRIEVLQVPSQQGEFVRCKGDYATAGQVLLAAGIRMTPAMIAVAAAAQCPQVWVYRRPQVAIFSTGDELVTPAQPLAPGQIVDSNQPAIAALVRQWGGEPSCLGIVADQPADLREVMAGAIATADIVISTGGVSVGDYDYVEQVLAELGGELQVTSVAIKPGKPLTVATFRRSGKSVLFFGLPGNPVSALVGCWRFVYLSFQQVAGVAEPQLPWLTAVSGGLLRGDSRRDCLLWGRVTMTDGQMTFLPVAGGHNSGNLINLSLANALALVTVERGAVPIGELVPVLWLDL